MELIVVVTGFIIAYGVVSGRLQNTIITGAMAFVAFGMLLSALGIIDVQPENEVVKILVEFTLVLVLFTDASRIDLRALRREHNLPIRMLVIGLPLVVIVGTIVGALVFPGQDIWVLALLAAVLAPTDAALGQAVVSSKLVPVRIRQALNVESGLNDGLATPIVLVMLSLANASETPNAPFLSFFAIAIQLIVIGAIAGGLSGFVGGKLVAWGTRTGWMDGAFQRICGVAIALLAYSLAEFLGGNGLIAAFVAGMVIGNTVRHVCECLYEFAEAEGQLVTLLVFLLFGSVMVFPALQELNVTVIVYAILSLTIVRMLPIALSLIGTKLQFDSVLFLGWFGPRGLASILFGLMVLEDGLVQSDVIFQVVVITVLMSVFIHGMSAYPAVKWYHGRVESRPDTEDLPEMQSVTEMPVRYPF